jgi:hypothetical protein
MDKPSTGFSPRMLLKALPQNRIDPGLIAFALRAERAEPIGVEPQRGVRLTPRLRRSGRPSLRVTLRTEPRDLAAPLQPIVNVGLAGQAGNNADLFAGVMGLDVPVAFGNAFGAKFDAR